MKTTAIDLLRAYCELIASGEQFTTIGGTVVMRDDMHDEVDTLYPRLLVEVDEQANALEKAEAELKSVTSDRDSLVFETDALSVQVYKLRHELAAYEAFADVACGAWRDGSIETKEAISAIGIASATLRAELDKLKKQARGGE